MKILLLAILGFTPVLLKAQTVVDLNKTGVPVGSGFYTVGGEPVSILKYVRIVDGSPFFQEDWILGSLVLAGGRRYDSLLLRLDLVANELHYLDGTGKPFVATTPVSEIWLKDASGNTKYHFINSETMQVPFVKKGWYQLLAGGPALLLKQFDKRINEGVGYGTGVREQAIVTETRYFILSGKVLSPFKKTNDLPALLKEKKVELEDYIRSNHLDSKSEESFINLVSYYNSIGDK